MSFTRLIWIWSDCFLWEKLLWSSQQPRNIGPMLPQWWPTVYDVGPTLSQHWIGVSCILWAMVEWSDQGRESAKQGTLTRQTDLGHYTLKALKYFYINHFCLGLQFEIIIYVLVSSSCFISIHVLWIYTAMVNILVLSVRGLLLLLLYQSFIERSIQICSKAPHIELKSHLRRDNSKIIYYHI